MRGATTEEISKVEELPEDVVKIGEGVWIEALSRSALQSLMAVVVIGGAFLRVAQDAVSLCGFLEFLFGFGVVRIAVGVVLERQLTIGALQYILVGAAGDTQNFVVISLAHLALRGSHRHAHHRRAQ